VPDADHAVQELLGVAQRARGDLLLEAPPVGGAVGEVVPHPGGQRGDDRRRQRVGRGRQQPSGVQPRRHLPGLPGSGGRVDGRVDRTVDRHQVAAADELVDLQVVHVSAAAGLGRVQHHEHGVVVDVHPRQGVALEAVVHGAGVEARA
jgi:hypothetical protein